MRYFPFIALLCSLFLLSCNSNTIVDEFIDVSPDAWDYNDGVSCNFEIEDTNFYYQWYANLRVSTDYKYSNLNLKLTTTFPDSTTKEEFANVILAEKSGKWLGTGIGGVLSYQQPIFNLKTHKQKGNYTVKIEQDMRIKKLNHVHSAGLKITKEEEIF